jgi:type I restriction enzyme S subunit
MELKPGYKLTEVGVIPEDWEVKAIGEIADVKTGPFGSTLHERDYVADGTPIITVEHLGELGVEHFNLPMVSNTDRNRLRSYSLKTGDLVFSRVGSIDRNALIRKTEDGWLFSGRLLRVRVKRASIITPEYLTYHFHSEPFKQRVREIAVGQTMPSLNTQLLKSVVTIVPTESEQRAISTVLSDTDALIESLDRLIAKKQDVKQATMQQLLTGKTRLPGFSGEWEVKRLGEVFAISAGSSKSAYISAEGDYWICDMGSVSTEGQLIVSKRTSYRGDFLLAGDLIMPKDDIGGGKIIGKVGHIDQDDTYILGDHVYCLRAREGDSRFLTYRINSYETNSALRKKVIGSAQLGLGRKSVEEQEILFPSPTEQTAIATILSDLDAEIAALEARRDKTRALKQGMMQELLTGKTRLVKPDAAHG